MDALTTEGFDYSQLGPHAEQVRHYANVIRNYERKTFDGIVMIGNTLRYAKNQIPHGLFGDWVEAEFPHWSHDTSLRYMRIAEAHEQKPQIAKIGISALHELLKPDVEPEAVEEAIERTESGETVTVAAARKIAERHKPSDEAEDEAHEYDEQSEPEPFPVTVAEDPALYWLDEAFQHAKDLFALIHNNAPEGGSKNTALNHIELVEAQLRCLSVLAKKAS